MRLAAPTDERKTFPLVIKDEDIEDYRKLTAFYKNKTSNFIKKYGLGESEIAALESSISPIVTGSISYIAHNKNYWNEVKLFERISNFYFEIVCPLEAEVHKL